MKILHLSTSLNGGAGIAASRLNYSLMEQGIESKIFSLDGSRSSTPKEINIIERRRAQRYKSKALTASQKYLFQKSYELLTPISLSAISIESILSLKPDLIHIHGFYNLLSIERIAKLEQGNIPIVVTLHDERFFTSGCHQASACKKFESNCTSCPQATLIGKKAIEIADRKKLSIRSRLESITFVAPSNWILGEAYKSNLLKNANIINIPNVIPRNPFYVNRNIQNRKTKGIIFSCGDLTNPYKGVPDFLEGMRILRNDFKNKDLEVTILGKGAPSKELSKLNIQIRYIQNDLDMAKILGNADLVVVPSIADNSPSIIGEALLSGTKVIGTRIGGIPELINDEKYLFDAHSPSQMARILQNFENEYNREEVSNQAIRKFDEVKATEKFIKLYRNLIT